MKISIFDSDREQAVVVFGILVSLGHNCEMFRTTADVLRGFAERPSDLIIVRLQKAKAQTGIVRDLRKHISKSVPILCLSSSAPGSDEEVIESLDAGADDYITGPLRRKELITRVMVLLRRNYPAQLKSDQFQFGAFVFEPGTGRLTKNGARVSVTRKEFDLALLFMRNIGQPLSRALIVDKVWDGRPPEMSRTVDTHISRMRSKLGLFTELGYRLSPLYSFGYRLDLVGQGCVEDRQILEAGKMIGANAGQMATLAQISNDSLGGRTAASAKA